VWQFDGANSLGLLTDLAALRLLASRMFGLVQLSASLGALYDWRGQFATGEAAAQVGLYLPGFRALKVYFEALGRGVPTYVQKDALPPDPLGQSPIHPQSVLGLGLSFHPHARVDLGVVVQRGFGGNHPGVVNFVMCDGSVKPVSRDTELFVLDQMCTRAGGEVIGGTPICPTTNNP
jgi:prepilin-type processing-associated H-X9-DG protein